MIQEEQNPNIEIRKRPRGPKHIQMSQRESTKSEARNSKQIHNDERQNRFNVPNKIDRIPRFEISDFEISLAWVCFGFRASDFGFSILEFVSVRVASFEIRISNFVFMVRQLPASRKRLNRVITSPN